MTTSERRARRLRLWSSLGAIALLGAALGLLSAAAPAKTPAAAPGKVPAAARSTAPVELVETRPIETAIGNPEVAEVLPAWLALIDGAKHTIDLEQFYLSTWPGEPMDPILASLGQAAKRGVKLRLILDARMYRTYPRAADSLAGVPGWQVRLVDFGRITGGVQHSKFFLVDGEIAYVGSQNFDWRSLKHIHELGVAIRDARVTSDFEHVFDMDWNVARAPSEPADTTKRAFVPLPFHAAGALPYRIVQAPGDTVELWPGWSPRTFIPDTTRWDLRFIERTLDAAKSEIAIQIYSYSPRARDGNTLPYDTALRSAAARGVRVKLIVPDWTVGGSGFKSIQDLAAVPNVEVKLSSVPEWSGGYIPFARVEHCKYMVVDTLVTWVGTDNWEPSYFFNARNLSVTMSNRRLAAQARAIFESSWTAPSASALDPKATYTPRTHGEQAPAGRTKYGG
jgi:phosphatidylserine/phosphatidylglycerophosphate/cardiolipin synthase-like enzyme